MADCTQLEKTIVDIVEGLATKPEFKNLDDVFSEINRLFPEITRDMTIDSIVNVTKRERKQAAETDDTFNEIKREARTEKKVTEQIKELEHYRETGELPPTKEKPKRDLSERMQNLKDIRDGLKKQIHQSEPAYADRLRKQIETIDKQIETGDFPVREKAPEYESPDILKLEMQRDDLRQEKQEHIESIKPKSTGYYIGAGIDAIRVAMTTGELSLMLRQLGAFAYMHPVKWAEANVKAFNTLWDKTSAYEINKRIMNRPTAGIGHKAGLHIIREGERIERREEFNMNRWANKIPIVKDINRWGVAVTNTARAELFDSMYYNLGKTGKGMTAPESEIAASWANIITGRGELGKLEPITLAANRVFFALRYITSRFQLLTGYPMWKNLTWAEFTGKDPGAMRVRKMIAKEYARMGLGLAAVYTVGAMFGGDEEESPISSDFGKIVFDERIRLDPALGMAQPIVFLSRLISGKSKSATTDEVNYLYGDNKKYGGREVKDVIWQFARSKASPGFGLMMNILTRENYFGEPATFQNTVLPLMYPITYGDICDVMKEDNVPENVAFAALAFMGMGLQTYGQYDRFSDEEMKKKLDNAVTKSGRPRKKREDDVKRIKDELQQRKTN